MSTKEKEINYVIDVEKNGIEIASVTVKFKTGDVVKLPAERARQLGEMGQLYGYVNYDFVPCLQFNSEYLYEYFLKGNILYKADSASIYLECNDRLGGDCSLYTIKDFYVICYKGKHFVVKSHLLTSGFNVNDTRMFVLKDGRMYVVVQGMSTFNFGTVQAVYNELMYVTEEGVYCLYHSNKKRMEKMVQYYKPVDSKSSKLADIQQKIVNASIDTELNRLDVTCRENVIFIGNLAIDMGEV